MKNKFNFLQIANWLYICYKTISSIKKNLPREEKKKILLIEKRKIQILRDVLTRKTVLQGINNKFLRELANIKKEIGVEE